MMLGRLVRNIVQDPKWGQWGTLADLNDFTANSAAGTRVTPDSALRLLTVYGCVSFLGDVIATMPIDQFRKLPSGQRQEVSQRAQWLDQPNTDTDRIAFINQALSSWLLEGHLFLAPVRNPVGQVVEVYVLDPCVTNVQRVAGKTVVTQNGKPYPGEVLHMPAFIKPGQLRGLSPIGYARESIGLAQAAQDHGAAFFRNGTTLSGVLQFPGGLTPDQLKELKRNWISHHQGSGKAHLPGVVTGGGEWKPLSISSKDAQFLESRQFEAAQISAMLFRIDPSVFGLGQSGQSLTYQNIDQRWIELSRRAFMPWTARLELLLSLMLPRPQYIRFNYDSYVRPDIGTRYDSYTKALDGHWMTITEVRALEDLAPLDNGEEFPPTRTTTPATPTEGTPPPAPPSPSGSPA